MLTLIAHSSPSSDQTVFAFLGFGLLAAYVLLVIGAFFSALFSEASGGMKLVWIIFIVMAPFIGSLLWFLVGKNNAREPAYRS
ncbi:PLD nuclease N-terminal domain-containing protein [Kribbella sp. NBC_01505]|uniref:PLD nuclease N-terminal domain-containing protein n=1 Tax=Kribbella sp. NBC_01505 TaxID=2903580 RepID=UPI00386765F4